MRLEDRHAAPAESGMSSGTGIGDIGGRLDRLPITWLHAALIAACSVGFGFDLLEMALGNALSAVFSAPPHSLSASRLSPLLSAVYFGGLIGAPLLGWLAGRIGRRTVLSAGLLWLASMSLAMVFTDSIPWLTAIRALSGIALGAYPPLMLALLTDVLPPARRGLLIMATIALAALGQPAGILLVRWLTPIQPLGIEAWKWAFLLGSAGAVAAAILFRLVPESPRWLAAAGRDADAEAAFRAFADAPVLWRPKEISKRLPVSFRADANAPFRRYRRAFAVVSALYFLGPWAIVGFPLTTGAVLIGKGYRLSDTLLYIGIASFGAFLGTFATAFAVDRVQRRSALAICAGAMALAVGAFAVSGSPVWLIASNLAFFFVSNIYLAALGVYTAELFPTPIRSAASASAWAVNRLGSVLAPPALLFLLHTRGSAQMFATVAAILALSVGIVLGFGPRGRAGEPVE
jgi:putative MFS transporter